VEADEERFLSLYQVVCHPDRGMSYVDISHFLSS
jgi:hypothetical protein